MYSVYAKKGNETLCIYNDKYVAPETISLTPTLDLVESNAGTFKIKLPPQNNGYEFIDRLNTEIIVKRDGEEIWSGRVINEDIDFWKNRRIECEGELAYLNDTIQPQAEFHDITPTDLLRTFLNIHNQTAPADKQFALGTVTVTDPNDSLYRYTNYETTLAAINSKLVEKLGGYLHIRKENGVRYLDYLAEHPETATQPIRFGVNLLDFSKTFDSTDFCTVLLPLGKMLDAEEKTSTIEALEQYLTIESVNEGSPYLINEDSYEEFGWIAKVVHWDNVTVASMLKSKAEAYLTDLQFDNMELEVTVADMHYTDREIAAINLSDNVRVISKPHGLDRYFPVQKISIPLDNPADTKYTIGSNVKIGFTERSATSNAELQEQIQNMPSESSILSQAKKKALEMLLEETQGGYVVYEYDQNNEYMTAINVCNELTIDASTKRWRWSQNGFGYMHRDTTSDDWSNLEVAMTIDGGIVANFITAGTMLADRIQGGTLSLGGSENGNGVLKIYDSSGNQIGKWDNGGISASSGKFKGAIQSGSTISGATISGGSVNINNRFKVDGQGNVIIKTAGGNTDYLKIEDDSTHYIHLGGTGIYAYGAGGSMKIKDIIEYLHDHGVPYM